MRYLLLLLSFLAACAVRPTGSYTAPPGEIDYADPANWAALPTKADAADLLPDPDIVQDRQADAPVDVFFIYPTIYWSERGDRNWNAPLDPEMNARIDSSAIKNQASIFNGVGKVYAPYYRQAHIHAYRTVDTTSARRAFDRAYADLTRAFDHFLTHQNRGRPFLIASHSQGTTHAKRLIRERVEGTELQERLVAAYLVGIAVPPNYFAQLPVCENAEQTNCFVTWRTYREGATAEFYPEPGDALVVNPLTWTTGPERAPRALNEGAVLRKFYDGFLPNLVEARVAGSVLYTNQPKFPGSFFFRTKNYHIADYNFFWLDVRRNAQARVAAFLQSEKGG